MKEKLDQYQLLSLRYNQLLSTNEIPELEKRNITQELSMIDRLKDELQWRTLTGSEKQQKRILSLQKMKRWDSEFSSKQKDWTHYENVINLYDQVTRTIRELEEGDKLKDSILFKIARPSKKVT